MEHRLPSLEAGGEEEGGGCCFHLSPQRGRAALGGAVDSRWVLGGAPRILIVGDPNAPNGVGAPLPPIKKMNKANPSAQERSGSLGARRPWERGSWLPSRALL